MGIPHAAREDTQLGGYNIPKGTMVVPNIFSVHMDPNLWPEPHKFKPERFLDAQGKVFKRETFIPFSLGRCRIPNE
jgi:cytochrome P450 family 2 subfamily U polypeptide 1